MSILHKKAQNGLKTKQKTTTKIVKGKKENVTTSISGKSTSTTVRDPKNDSKTNNAAVDAKLKKSGAYSASDAGKKQMKEMARKSKLKKMDTADKANKKKCGGIMPYAHKKK